MLRINTPVIKYLRPEWWERFVKEVGFETGVEERGNSPMQCVINNWSQVITVATAQRVHVFIARVRVVAVQSRMLFFHLTLSAVRTSFTLVERDDIGLRNCGTTTINCIKRSRIARFGRPISGRPMGPMSVMLVYWLWPNDWMDRDVTRYGARPRPRRHYVRWGPSSAHGNRGTAAPPLSARVYCGQTVARLSNCWALVAVILKVSRTTKASWPVTVVELSKVAKFSHHTYCR